MSSRSMRLPPHLVDDEMTARFWSRVERRGPEECWEWQAGCGSHGYGVFYPCRGYQMTAHRFSLLLTTRSLPTLEALHSCDNKRCVNPVHLRWGTHAQNMQDAADRNLMFAPKKNRSHCPHGHAMDGDNVIEKLRTHHGRTYVCRSCRECNRIYLKNRRQRRKAAQNG